MTNALFLLLACGASYLIGSVSFAIFLSKVFRLQDPRQYGSHNPGATNVLRSGNKSAALLVLLLDGAKGAFAVALVGALVSTLVSAFARTFDYGPATIAIAGLCAFMGHVWPIFHRFKGGKGVATFMGVALALNWPIGVVALLAWLAVALISRYSSLAALLGTCIALVAQALAYDLDATFIALALMFGILLWRHQSNISHLLSGKEKKINLKKS